MADSQSELPVSVRLAEEGDLRFIYPSWLHSYWKGGDVTQHMVWTTFRFYHRITIHNLLTNRPGVVVLVACSTEEPDLLFGYIVAEYGMPPGDVLHYLYVKDAWRQMGIAKRLVEAARLDPHNLHFTHYTRNRHDKETGELRWPGAEMLLGKFPLAREERDPRTKQLVLTNGNLYVPYL